MTWLPRADFRFPCTIVCINIGIVVLCIRNLRTSWQFITSVYSCVFFVFMCVRGGWTGQVCARDYWTIYKNTMPCCHILSDNCELVIVHLHLVLFSSWFPPSNIWHHTHTHTRSGVQLEIYNSSVHIITTKQMKQFVLLINVCMAHTLNHAFVLWVYKCRFLAIKRETFVALLKHIHSNAHIKNELARWLCKQNSKQPRTYVSESKSNFSNSWCYSMQTVTQMYAKSKDRQIGFGKTSVWYVN